jgi:putative hemolysin
MRLSLLASLLLVTSLAGCAFGGSRPGAATTAADTVPAVAALDAAACTAQGGELRPLGRLQRVQCVVPYADAGKTCNARADCSGQCLAIGEVVAGSPASGVCQRDASENFGCRQRIDGGVAQGTICVD